MKYAAGVDGGSSAIKAVLVHEDGAVETVALLPVGSRPLHTAREVLQALRDRASSPGSAWGPRALPVARFARPWESKRSTSLSLSLLPAAPGTRTCVPSSRWGWNPSDS